MTETSKIEPAVEHLDVYYPIKDNRIKVDLDKPEKASLFDYFSHIELIPLETKDDLLIGYCEEINYYENKYYIFDRKQLRIQSFDITGKFISQIDKRGQGPGEYTDLASIFVNSFTKTIDLTGLGLIYSYDLTGNHVRTTLRPERTHFFWNFIALNDNLYVCYVLFSGQFDPYKINYYDVKENEIIHKEYEDDIYFYNYPNVSITSHTPFYEYNGKWFFYRFTDNDTYEVGVDSLMKSYTWDFQKYNYNARKLNLPNDISALSTLPYRIELQGQNNRYLMAHIRTRNNKPAFGAYLIYDKSTDECKYIDKFTESVEFVPRKITNEYVLTWCEHGALENYISKDILDENNRQKFQKLLDAKDEMNPVLIKYYFK